MNLRRPRSKLETALFEAGTEFRGTTSEYCRKKSDGIRQFFPSGKTGIRLWCACGRAKSDLSVNSHRENFIFVFIAHRPFRGALHCIGYTRYLPPNSTHHESLRRAHRAVDIH